MYFLSLQSFSFIKQLEMDDFSVFLNTFFIIQFFFNDAAFADLNELDISPFYLPHSATPSALSAHAPSRHTQPPSLFFGAPTLTVAESIYSYPFSINEWWVGKAAEWITCCGNQSNDLPLLGPHEVTPII